MNTVENDVISVIADKLGIEEKGIFLSSRFHEDLGADSLEVLEIVFECEALFGVDMEDDAENVLTVKDAVQYIIQRIEN